ncbi:MAG: alcohol dehydrogenase catalytic domain-containing protein [Planctomycetes bacterium]|nr:alcohol dehydrogenase catalytic domain-containing protein [Planctomycetota bacterium]
MRALLVDERGVQLRDDVPAPTPEDGEVRVRVSKVGLCSTDLALARGYMGFRGVPGHEFVGVALEGALRGRRVVGEINAACGRCPTCLAGGDRHCPRRSVLGILGRPGALAEELRLPARNLRAVPDSVGDDAAVFTEPLAAALALGEACELVPGARALVVGDGKLGLLCAHVLARAGLAVTLAGRHPERNGLTGIAVDHVGPLERAGGGFELAVEASGDPDALPALLPRMRPRGTVVLKTTTERATSVELAPLVVDELRLVGSRCGRFEPALAALASGTIAVERLIVARYPLADAERAFEHAARRGTLKVLIEVHP